MSSNNLRIIAAQKIEDYFTDEERFKFFSQISIEDLLDDLEKNKEDENIVNFIVGGIGLRTDDVEAKNALIKLSKTESPYAGKVAVRQLGNFRGRDVVFAIAEASNFSHLYDAAISAFLNHPSESTGFLMGAPSVSTETFNKFIEVVDAELIKKALLN